MSETLTDEEVLRRLGVVAGSSGPDAPEAAAAPAMAESVSDAEVAARLGITSPGATTPGPKAGLEGLKDSFQSGLIEPIKEFASEEVTPRLEKLEALNPLELTARSRESRASPVTQAEHLKKLAGNIRAAETLKQSPFMSTSPEEFDYLGETNKLLKEAAYTTRREGPYAKPPRPGAAGAVIDGIGKLLGVPPRAIIGALEGLQQMGTTPRQGEEPTPWYAPFTKAASAALGSFAEDPADRASVSQLYDNALESMAGGKESLPEFKMRHPHLDFWTKVAAEGGELALGAALPPWGKARPGAVAPHVRAAGQVSKALGKDLAKRLGSSRILDAAKGAFAQNLTPVEQLASMARRLGLNDESTAALVEAFGPGAAGLGKQGAARVASEFLEAHPGFKPVAGGLSYGADLSPGSVDLIRAPMAAKGMASKKASDIFKSIKRAVPEVSDREAMGRILEMRQGIAEGDKLTREAAALRVVESPEAAARAVELTDRAADYAKSVEAAEGGLVKDLETGSLLSPSGRMEFIKAPNKEGILLPEPVNLGPKQSKVWNNVRGTLDEYNAAEQADGLIHNEVAEYFPGYARHKGNKVREVSLGDRFKKPGLEAFRKAKDPGHAGSRIYDVAEVMALRHRASAVARANAQLEDRVMNAFGLRPDKVAKSGLGPEYVEYTGMLGKNKGRVVYLKQADFTHLSNIVNPRTSEEALSIMDDLLSEWKAWVTVGNGPGFAVRNITSNVGNMLGNGVSARKWLGRMAAADSKFGGTTQFGPVEGLFGRGLRKLAGAGGGSFKVAGMEPQQVIQLAEKMGVVEAGYVATEIGEQAGRAWHKWYNPLSKKWIVSDLTSQLNEYFERVSKLAVFADRLEKGWTPAEAAKYAIDTIFSMREVPAGVAKAAAVAPFIRWSWKQWGFNLTKLLSDPKVMYRYAKILESAQATGDSAETAKLRRAMGPAIDMGLLALPSESEGGPALSAAFLQGFAGLSNVEFFNPAHVGENALRMLHPVFNVIASLSANQTEEGEVKTQSNSMPYIYKKQVKPYTFVSDTMDWLKDNRPEDWMKVVRSGFITPTQPGRNEYIDKLMRQGVSSEQANAKAHMELPVVEYRWSAEVPKVVQWLAPQVSSVLNLFKPKDEATYEAIANAIVGIKFRTVLPSETNRQRAFEAGQNTKQLKAAAKEMKTGR